MSFFSVLLALLLEQLKALPSHNQVHAAASRWVDWTARHLDAGESRHAWMLWAASVLVPTLAVAGAYALVWQQSRLLALTVNIGVLYFTLGFRQFSHYFTDIRDAFERGDERGARELLARWRHIDTSDLPRTELLRHVIEFSTLAAHRHVFGVFFWFVALSALGLGPAGAVFYRLAEFCGRHWGRVQKVLQGPEHPVPAALAQRLFVWVDHAPARLTASGFAVVGNFEEAVASWRRNAHLWPQANDGVILAAASGAVGVQLGGRAADAGAEPNVNRSPEASSRASAKPAANAQGSQGMGEEGSQPSGTSSTAGVPAQVGHLQSVVGLVWRSVVLWMLLLALLTMANILG